MTKSAISPAQAYGGVLIDTKGLVLLREPTGHFDGYVWTFAKGKPEPGDTPTQTALREVLEETGYQAEIIGELPGVYHSGLSSNAYFVMRPIKEAQKPDWETQSTRWVSFEEAQRLIGMTTNEKGKMRDLAVLAACKIWSINN